ncbi:hypothetical protein [Streptomyces sp. YIM 98790]|uniref:hypothetical protein n=1 Tax=Streptomyces sp. YIM 98790 TaxID=2689077 RepID=UPI001A9E62D3|nr:hypothetical protein [Streptomyces sp. YIM 98790]
MTQPTPEQASEPLTTEPEPMTTEPTAGAAPAAEPTAAEATTTEPTAAEATATEPSAAAAPAAGAAPPFVHRRWVRAVTRWTLAAALFAGAGTLTAHQITERERTDVPGLATEADGRWDYPELTLPPLPEGSPAPFADANDAEVHHADLRELLLPAPASAGAHPELPETGWLAPEEFTALFGSEKEQRELADAFGTLPLRQISRRAWSMPDGTTTEIYLLRFTTGTVAEAFFDQEFGVLATRKKLAAAPSTEADGTWPEESALIGDVRTVVRTEVAPLTDGHTRLAHLRAGDILGLVVQTHPDNAAEVPFHQTVILQAQLLG